jgi:hypothetical protein
MPKWKPARMGTQKGTQRQKNNTNNNNNTIHINNTKKSRKKSPPKWVPKRDIKANKQKQQKY